MNRTIKDYPDYEVTDDGRVYSHKTNKFLKENVLNTGYATVELFNKNGSKRISIHRLVANAFIPNPKGLPCVNHKDENRQNNRVDNLEWCTHKYNSNYGNCRQKIRERRYVSPEKMRKFHLAGAMANARPIKDKTTGKTYPTIIDAQRDTGINASHIGEVCKGKRLTAGKHEWEYIGGDDLSVSQY